MFDLPRVDSPIAGKSAFRRARNAKDVVVVATYTEIDGVGMGLLSTGEPFLTQRGLAALCGVQNAHIGTISRDWTSTKPRIAAIQGRLGFRRAQAHRVLSHDGHRLFAYDTSIAQAVLSYYAVDVAKPQAVRNHARFADNGLSQYIRAQFDAPMASPPPLRFEPVATPETDGPQDAATAFLMHVWALYVLGFWMAVNHIEELRQKVAKAPWNRLGLYLPLKAFLEIQAEVVRRHSTFTLR